MVTALSTCAIPVGSFLIISSSQPGSTLANLNFRASKTGLTSLLLTINQSLNVNKKIILLPQLRVHLDVLHTTMGLIFLLELLTTLFCVLGGVDFEISIH